MGKPRHKRRSDILKRMDQHSVGDGSGSAELGSIRELGSTKPSSPVGNDAPEPVHNDDSVSVDRCDIRRGGERIRISRREASEVRRTFDRFEVNGLLNRSDILLHLIVPGIEKLDATALLEDKRNYALMANSGLILFTMQDFGVYEVQVAFPKERRGDNALRGVLAALWWMFINTDCLLLIARVLSGHAGASSICANVGAHFEFERGMDWTVNDGSRGIAFWTLSFADWYRNAPELAQCGEEFRQLFFAERERLGFSIKFDADEPAQRAIGAFWEMMRAHCYEKAVAMYNRWAMIAQASMVALVSKNPVLIDSGDAVIHFQGDTFKVIRCH